MQALFRLGVVGAVGMCALPQWTELASAEPMDEIIVTAQKRAEDVRDVPISISVVSDEMLTQTGSSTFDDVAKFLPNVSVNMEFNSFYMRGIGSAELNVIGEQAVSYIIDDMYVPRLEYVRAGFMDIRSIEVLKGPQGTLFGRNATAGVINISTQDPGEEFEVSGQITYGQDNFTEYEAVLSVPLSDQLGIRFSGKSHQKDGATYSVTSDDQIGDRDYQQLRGKLKWDITNNLDATLTVSWFQSYVGVWLNNEVFYDTPEIATLISAMDPDYEPTHNRRTSLEKGNNADNQGWMVPLEINWEIGEYVLTTVSAFAKIDDTQGGDIDSTNADLVEIHGGVSQEQFSQELRIVSPPGIVEFIAGVYYLESETTAYFDLPVVPNGVASLGTGGIGGLIGPLLGFGASQIDALLAPLAGIPLVTGAGDTAYGNTAYELSSLGVFGQLKWNISDSLALIGGLRYSDDNKTGSHSLQHGSPAPLFVLLTGPAFNIQGKKIADSSITPKISALWDVTETVTAYATFAQGFRAGSFNIAALGPDEVSFDGESSTTYETGLKTKFWGGAVRANLGAFLTEYEDYQLAAFNGFGYVTANADKVESKGIEFDITAFPAEGLMIAGSAGYNKAKFVSFPNGGCQTQPGVPPIAIFEETCDLTDMPLHRSPKWNASLRFDYSLQPIKSWPVELALSGDAAYKGFEYFDSDLDPIDSEKGHWLYNAKVALRSADGYWSLELHGKNLGDKLLKTFSGDVILQAGSHAALSNYPRQFFIVLRGRY